MRNCASLRRVRGAGVGVGGVVVAPRKDVDCPEDVSGPLSSSPQPHKSRPRSCTGHIGLAIVASSYLISCGTKAIKHG